MTSEGNSISPSTTFLVSVCKALAKFLFAFRSNIFIVNRKCPEESSLIWSSMAAKGLIHWHLLLEVPGSISVWDEKISGVEHAPLVLHVAAGLGGSVGCAIRLETRRSRVQPQPRSATFFRGDWSWNIFYGHSLPSADLRRAVVSFWQKNVHNTGWPLRGLHLSSKRVVR